MEKESCTYSEVGEGEYWECSGCEDAFVFEIGSPKDNHYNFCPNCGRKIIEFIHSEEISCIDFDGDEVE